MGKNKIAFIIAFVGLILAGCDDGMIAINSSEPIRIDFDTGSKTLKNATAKPYALMFVGKDCGSCDEQIKVVNQILGERKFEFIAVLNASGDYTKAKQIADEKALDKMPVIFDSQSVQYLSNAVGGIMGIPATYFYDSEGKMQGKFLGFTPKSTFEETIKQISE